MIDITPKHQLGMKLIHLSQNNNVLFAKKYIENAKRQDINIEIWTYEDVSKYDLVHGKLFISDDIGAYSTPITKEILIFFKNNFAEICK